MVFSNFRGVGPNALGWRMNHNRNTLALDALHNALDGSLTEVVAVDLHGQMVCEKDTGCCIMLCFF